MSYSSPIITFSSNGSTVISQTILLQETKLLKVLSYFHSDFDGFHTAEASK